jgi:malonyl-CoA O-methyltransferase
MNQRFDPRHIRRAFSRAAARYEATAVLQREVEARLLESLDEPDQPVPQAVLDLGSGPGRATAHIKKRWPKAQVLALDLSLPMLRQARRRAGWWRPFQCVCADAAALPLADASIDLLFSNLCLQWLPDLPAVFAQFRRVLRPGGRLLLSSFGPGTLGELREAFAAGDKVEHVSHFAPIQQIGDALLAAGFRDPVLDQDTFTLTYPDLRSLLHELQAIGATNALVGRRHGLTGKGRFAAATAAYEAMRRDGRLPSTWEVIYARAWAPAPGAPIRHGGGEVASVPVSGIGVRRY